MKIPTQEFLRERYSYDPSGFFVNKKTKKVVRGTLMTHGYRAIAMWHGQPASLYHRMVWLWHFGFLPKQIDHIDSDRANNKIENLRQCTATQNQAHRPAERGRSAGIKSKGVHWSGRETKPYRACIIRNRKYINLGRFRTEKEAAEAYLNYAKKTDGEFAMGGLNV